MMDVRKDSTTTFLKYRNKTYELRSGSDKVIYPDFVDKDL